MNEFEDKNQILRLLVDTVTDYAIFALDSNGNIITWNAGARKLKGYEATEIIGSHFSKFYTAEISREIIRNGNCRKRFLTEVTKKKNGA